MKKIKTIYRSKKKGSYEPWYATAPKIKRKRKEG